MPVNDAMLAAESAFYERIAAHTDKPDPAPTPAPADASTDAPASPESAVETPAADAATETKDPKDAPPAAATDAPATEPESDDDETDEDEKPAPKEAKDAKPVDHAFTDALAAEGVKLTLDDVPAEARPFVAQRVKELEAGFTKARQKDTAALVELRAEQRVLKENAADWIAAQIRGDAKLADAVNALLEEFEASPTAAKAHDIVVADAKAKALRAEQSAAVSAETRAAEDAALETRLESRLATAGVTAGPALERMLAQAAALVLAKDPNGRLTQAAIDEIADAYVTDQKAARDDARRLERRRTRDEYVRGKVADKSAGLVVKPGAGSTVAPAPAPPPKNDTEFRDAFAARLDERRRVQHR